MKPFDLEAAKAGAPVVTRDGKKARIICFDLNNGEYVLIALVTHYSGLETVLLLQKDGRRLPNSEHSTYDLFMASVKKEGWLNIYPNEKVEMWPTKDLAGRNSDWNIVACVRVEWEE
jgi:hypothetical protein